MIYVRNPVLFVCRNKREIDWVKIMTIGGKESASINTILELKNKEGRKVSKPKVKALLKSSDEVEATKAEEKLSLANKHLMEAINLQVDMEFNIRQHLKKAKELYSNVLSSHKSFIIPYYGLFKVAILEQNYSEAFLQLQAYDMGLATGCNFNLMYQMLMMLSGQKEHLKEANPNYIQDVKVSYEPILNNYHFAENAFHRGDYQRVIKHLTVCSDLARKKGFDIEFSIMLQLANTILSLSKEKKKNCLRTAFSLSTDVGKRMLLVQELLELDATDFESNFLYMDAYIDLKAYNPLVECIEHLKTLPATKEEQEFINLYERLVSEIVIESKHLREIYATLKRGEDLQQEALYSEAITCYENTNENVPLPYFQIKKAEAYYAMGNLEEAIECCENYLKSGYLHYVEASILLYKIYRDKGDVTASFAVAFKCYRKARMQERGIFLHDWLSRLNSGYCSESKGQTSKEPKQYVYQGITKK